MRNTTERRNPIALAAELAASATLVTATAGWGYARKLTHRAEDTDNRGVRYLLDNDFDTLAEDGLNCGEKYANLTVDTLVNAYNDTESLFTSTAKKEKTKVVQLELLK